MAITVDENTHAAIPGQIAVSKSRFLDYYEIIGLGRFYYSILLTNKFEKLDAKYPNNNVVRAWVQLNEHFLYGCANPVKVINRQKGIYASYSDLTNDGGESTPVIKIVQLRYGLMEKTNLQDGDKTVSVALYYRDPNDMDARAWADFDPRLPHLFSDDEKACKDLEKKIKSAAWKCLEIGLEQIDNKEEPGLYHVGMPNKLSQNAY